MKQHSTFPVFRFPSVFFLCSSPAWSSLLISPALLPDLQSAVPTHLHCMNPSPTSSDCHFPDLRFPASHPLVSLVCILSPVICSVTVEPSVQFPSSCCWVSPPSWCFSGFWFLAFSWIVLCLLFVLFAFVLGVFAICLFFLSIFGFHLHFIKTRRSALGKLIHLLIWFYTSICSLHSHLLVIAVILKVLMVIMMMVIMMVFSVNNFQFSFRSSSGRSAMWNERKRSDRDVKMKLLWTCHQITRSGNSFSASDSRRRPVWRTNRS